MNTDLEHCISMIKTEEQHAAVAPSKEAAEVHHQIAMLYRVQLDHLRAPALLRGIADWGTSRYQPSGRGA